MIHFLNILFLLSLALSIGSMVFFSAFVTPVAFHTLGKLAGDYLSKLFPLYYQLGYGTHFAGLFCLTVSGILQKNFPIARVVLMGLMLIGTLYAGLSLHPKIHMIKTVKATMEAGPLLDAKEKEFSNLHRISVLINLFVLACGIATLVITAFHLDRVGIQ